MDPSLLTVAAGMRAQVETLEVIGNNIANASTHGYKADRDFYRLFLSAQAQADPLTGQISRMPVVQGSTIDFNQGTLIPTEGPLDLALSGPGFLVVEGPGGEIYTRSGSLRRSASGVLETAEGFSVLDSQRGSITIPPNGKIEVGAGGVISVEGLQVAELLVVEFEKGAGLSKVGNSYFRAADGISPQPAVETSLNQGRLEASNVNVAEEAVRLMLSTRHFQMMRRVASLVGDELNGRAVEVLGSTR